MTLAEEVLANLKKSNAVLSTVESCTGGLIASMVTDIPGSSEGFWGGFVVYDNLAKIRLGVSESTLQKEGAVSEPTARELARAGAQQALSSFSSTPPSHCSYYGLSTTGIAGPSGGSEKKPVGLCYIGLACIQARGLLTVDAIRFQVQGPTQRQNTKAQFAQAALSFLLERLKTLK